MTGGGWSQLVGRWAVVGMMALAWFFADGLRAQESPTVSAMQDEMKRSMAQLRMKGEAAPYYIAYEVLDRTVQMLDRKPRVPVQEPVLDRQQDLQPVHGVDVLQPEQ